MENLKEALINSNHPISKALSEKPKIVEPENTVNTKNGGSKPSNASSKKPKNTGDSKHGDKDNEKYTNAGHYFYVKANRDFGKQLPDYTFCDILGVKPNNIIIHDIPYENYFKISNANTTFDLKTVYPGLLIGVGYTHPAEKKDNEKEGESDFQTGFYFDWTTGLPVIPGSTVKGVLRSVFPKDNDDKEVKKNKEKYLNNIIGETDIEELEKNIFEYGDIFYDAYIVQPHKSKKIFAEDYLAPHNSPFQDPIPLRFLKIAPDVTFRFQFNLKSYKEIKEKLFKEILLDFGIGAKRNTGYGVLENNAS